MLSDDFFTWYSLIFLAAFILAIFEILLSAAWNRWYFTWGIPLFRRKYGGDPVRQAVPTAEQLEYRMKGGLSHSIVFRELSATEYAFREKWLEFKLAGSTPVLRGLMCWDVMSGEVIVTGYLNWYNLLFIALFMGLIGLNVFAWLFLMGLFGLLYVIQAQRFDVVGKLASQAWRTGDTATDMTS